MLPRLEDVRWIELPTVRDERGALTAVEEGGELPFPIQRVFYLHGVRAPRGGHAHRDTDQVLAAVAGSLRVTLSDGERSRAWILDDPSRGLYTPRMLFVELDEFTPGAVMLAVCSTPYDRSRSIRSRAEFDAARRER